MNEERVNRALAKYARQRRKVERLLAMLKNESNASLHDRLELLLDSAEARLDGMNDILGCLEIIPSGKEC